MSIVDFESIKYKDKFYKYITRETESHKISERFKVLEQRENNWDGYESKKPSQLTLEHAKHLMKEYLDAIVSAGYSWHTPFISCDEDGNVTIEWSGDKRRLHIQIGEKQAEYIQVWGTNIDTEMHVDFLKPADYIILWKWLFNE